MKMNCFHLQENVLNQEYNLYDENIYQFDQDIRILKLDYFILHCNKPNHVPIVRNQTGENIFV